jgi:Response regulator containing CheY-like receiver, AAA-type ATPase, and DNA-binding domains
MSKRTILILDDDVYIRKYVSSLLESNGYEVVEARSARSASIQMRKQQFDLVIVDYRLPDCDGLSWISSQRDRGCKTPFIFLSGIFCDRVIAARLRNLFDVHLILQKPVDPEEFVRLVNIQMQQNSACIENGTAEFATDTHLDTDPIDFTSLEDEGSTEFELRLPMYELTYEPFELDEPEEDIELELLEWEYLKDLPVMLRELADDIERIVRNNDPAAVESALVKAHTMKGSSGLLSMNYISELAGLIENSLADRVQPPPLLSILEQLAATQSRVS